jgi:hypothetical protein
MATGAAGFWSYVHTDDAADHGLIRLLAERLRGEYQLLTGESLQLFVDRTSLQWGDAWDKRIKEAIAGTTFFIPIITPGYFKSAACRAEMLNFVGGAKRLGLESLIMPVYWSPVSELDSAGLTPPTNSSRSSRRISGVICV